MSEVNKSVVRELFAAWSAHDVDRVARCIGESCNGGGAEGFRREDGRIVQRHGQMDRVEVAMQLGLKVVPA